VVVLLETSINTCGTDWTFHR